MTQEQAQKLLPIIQAISEGKRVQWRSNNNPIGNNWTDWKDVDPPIGALYCEWRIKLEPLEVWVNVYPDGSIGRCYPTREAAENVYHTAPSRIVHMREVTEP